MSLNIKLKEQIAFRHLIKTGTWIYDDEIIIKILHQFPVILAKGDSITDRLFKTYPKWLVLLWAKCPGAAFPFMYNIVITLEDYVFTPKIDVTNKKRIENPTDGNMNVHLKYKAKKLFHILIDVQKIENIIIQMSKIIIRKNIKKYHSLWMK